MFRNILFNPTQMQRKAENARSRMNSQAYRCFNKLWTPATDEFDTLKDINDLNNFDSVHEIRNCDVGSTSSSAITKEKQM